MTYEQQTAITPVDGAAAAVGIGAFVGWLPSIAALFTILWTGVRLYETRTVQRLLPEKLRLPAPKLKPLKDEPRD